MSKAVIMKLVFYSLIKTCYKEVCLMTGRTLIRILAILVALLLLALCTPSPMPLALGENAVVQTQSINGGIIHE